ncbi:hypothetical protein [Citrobacter farmeri]|nr:hypothetical protein [Citrobacter farmeri]
MRLALTHCGKNQVSGVPAGLVVEIVSEVRGRNPDQMKKASD